jgi:hypothetical protein
MSGPPNRERKDGPMIKKLVLTALVAGALAGRMAMAQAIPWGGADEGYIPRSAQTLECENALTKTLGKALLCIAKCHQARAAGRLPDQAAEDNCESNVSNQASCKAKFNAMRDRLLSMGTCPACLGEVSMDQVFAQGVGFFSSSVNGQIYCGQ